MTTKRLAAAVVFSGLAALACSGLTPTEVPEDKADYVGAWAGQDTSLVIEQAGTAAWSTKSGGATTSLTGNIVFTDTGFSIGIGPMAKAYTATQPDLVGSAWSMTVDDIHLTRPASADEITDDGGSTTPGRGGRGGRGGRR